MEVHTLIFYAGALDSLEVELKGSKDFFKLYAGIAILGYIALVADSISTRAFSSSLSFSVFSAIGYPKIRKASADQVYLVLWQNEGLVAENKIDKALEIISETSWEGDTEAVKLQSVMIVDGNRNAMIVDENASYSSLVDSSGF